MKQNQGSGGAEDGEGPALVVKTTTNLTVGIPQMTIKLMLMMMTSTMMMMLMTMMMLTTMMMMTMMMMMTTHQCQFGRRMCVVLPV